ncbi:MAG: class I SAM-dependent methyltransferase [Ilumatobacteraceae bacterium]
MSTTAMRTLAETLVAVRDVEGWMTPDQAAELYRAAAATHVGDRIVEIGSFRGRSTIVLASAAPAGVEIVAIDPHAGNDRGPQQLDGFAAEADDDHDAFTANLAAAGVGSRVRHVRAFSALAHGAVDGGINVLYIDGAHRYAPALADIRSWGRRVTPGGTMLIHDSFSSVGVTLAIGRELLLGRRWRYAGRARSLAVYHADLDGTWASRVANAGRQLGSLPWFVKNLLVKVLLTLRLGGLLQRVAGHRPEWPY